MSTEPASHVSAADAPAIIVFDGVCHLCSGWVQFLLKRDHARRYRFASMQSEAGRDLLRSHGLDADDPSSFLLLRGAIAQTDSGAILSVLTGLGGVWRIAGVARLVPRALRDPLYRWLARRRYRLFGRRDTCWLPSPHHAGRFIE